VEPTHPDPAPERISPRPSPQPGATPPGPRGQAAAQATVFRRILDAQSTSHDATTVLKSATEEPTRFPSPSGRGRQPRWDRRDAAGTLLLSKPIEIDQRAMPSPPPAPPGRPPRRSRTRHSAGNRPARLPAAVGISAVLAVLGGLALILTNTGLSPDPTAPSALPDSLVSQTVILGAGAGVLRSAIPSPPATPSPTRHPSATASAKASAPVGPAPTATDPTSAPTTSAPAAPTNPPATAPAGGWVTVQRGSTGSEVQELQNQLTAMGYMQAGDGGYYEYCDRYWDSPGSYQSATKRAILEFQENYDYVDDADLPTTGICDAATWAALNTQPSVNLQYCF
jgi:Putative peptidoglycan binding domain